MNLNQSETPKTGFLGTRPISQLAQVCVTVFLMMSIYRPKHGIHLNILILIAYEHLLLKAYTDLSSDAGGLKFYLSLFYSHSLCIQEIKALARLHICVGLSEPLVIADKYQNLVCWSIYVSSVSVASHLHYRSVRNNGKAYEILVLITPGSSLGSDKPVH